MDWLFHRQKSLGQGSGIGVKTITNFSLSEAPTKCAVEGVAA